MTIYSQLNGVEMQNDQERVIVGILYLPHRNLFLSMIAYTQRIFERFGRRGCDNADTCGMANG
jgi:hypothetical protein